MGENFIRLHTRPRAWVHNKRLQEQEKYTYLKTMLPTMEHSEERLKKQKDALETREKAVYSSFFPGCKNYVDFRKNLIDIFANETDRKAFLCFSNAQIRQLLTEKYKTRMVGAQNKDIDLEIIVKNPEIVKLKLDKINTGNIKFDEKTIQLKMGVTDDGIKDIKKFFNKVFKTQFHTSSTNLKALTKFIGETLESPEFIATLDDGIGVEKVTGSKETVDSLSAARIVLGETAESYVPFNYKKEDLTEDNKTEIDRALNEIKTFIKQSIKYNSCSANFQKAFNTTWNRNISQKGISGKAHFLKGGDISYLVGAFGEFQTALIMNYLEICTKGKISSNAAAVIADTLLSRQGKTDVTIAKSLGIQVKNYNINALQNSGRGITTALSPEELLDRTSMITGEDGAMQRLGFDSDGRLAIEWFIANYCFNETFRSFSDSKDIVEKLENTFATYFAEMYHLSVDDQMSDTVLFYSFGGVALVPASAILDMVIEKTKARKPTKIKWKNDARSEEQYMERDKNGKSLSDLYWKRVSGYAPSDPLGWERIDSEQESLINNYLSNTRIESGFTLKKADFNFSEYIIFDKIKI